MSVSQMEEQVNVFNGLTDKVRISIVNYLAEHGESNVTQIAKHIGVLIVNVSHALKVLKASKLVTFRRDGRFIFYSLNSKFFNKANKTFKFDWGKIVLN